MSSLFLLRKRGLSSRVPGVLRSGHQLTQGSEPSPRRGTQCRRVAHVVTSVGALSFASRYLQAESQSLLKLISFLTVGEMEVRATR